MRILMLHNRYQIAGGEDAVVATDCELLRAHGHQVELLETDNDEIDTLAARVATAARCVYSWPARRALEVRLAQFHPDIVHLHNWFPRLSPSVICVSHAASVPLVHTLHNYRLLCCNALFLHAGKACEQCLQRRSSWPGAWAGCYRGSHVGSAIVAATIAIHRWAGTFDGVDRFIALTHFARNKFIAGGLAAARLAIKPNPLLRDPGPGSGAGGMLLYVGRLSEEKGIAVLLAAARGGRLGWPLRIVGAGPLESQVREAAAQADNRIEYLGPRAPEEVSRLMGEASALVMPSLCYEGFPRSLVESFAKGTPILASCLGSLEELIAHQQTGLLFAVANPAALITQAKWLAAHPAELQAMRCHARAEFEAKYTAEANYATLMRIYAAAVASCRARHDQAALPSCA